MLMAAPLNCWYGCYHCFFPIHGADFFFHARKGRWALFAFYRQGMATNALELWWLIKLYFDQPPTSATMVDMKVAMRLKVQGCVSL